MPICAEFESGFGKIPPTPLIFWGKTSILIRKMRKVQGRNTYAAVGKARAQGRTLRSRGTAQGGADD